MNTAELKKLAEAVMAWGLCDVQQGPDDAEAGIAMVGIKYDDGEFAEVFVIDAGFYYAEQEAIKIARYYAAANPAAILELLAINAELVEALKGMVMAWGSGFDEGDSPSLDKARAALARYEGEKS
jgi:hypothetical protein